MRQGAAGTGADAPARCPRSAHVEEFLVEVCRREALGDECLPQRAADATDVDRRERDVDEARDRDTVGVDDGARRQVEHALNEAESLRPSAKFVVFCAFAFDPEAAKDIDETKWAGVTLLKAQMNTDMLTEDLKKGRSTNQSFWLMGQPDVQLSQTKAGLWQVEVNGFDYFDTAKGELVSGGKGKIAAWSLDTDYDGRSLFPHQFFFPMAGKDEGWMKLKKDIRAELDADLLQAFTGTVSLPFAAGDNRMVAVKIVDDRGIESLKVMRLDGTPTPAA